jgi:adenylate cyclase
MKTLPDRTHIPDDIKPAVRRPGARASRLRRRLAAVMGADILGYSALIGGAEEQVHRRVGAELERICREAEKSHGRIFTYAGDSLMVEFPSAVEALRCAMRVQESSARRNARLDPRDRILFRIGLNTGEVVVQGDRIGGTTVNVAARLEAIAEPGGIALSATVFQQVQRTIPAPYEPIGERRLKNIRDAVQVYALGAAVFTRGGVSAPTPPRADVVPLPQGFERQPAIAVLPLRSFSADDEPFTDALTEELINALSRWRSFPVIARNSVFAYRGRELDVRVIGRELGARYMVTGNVRRHGERVRVTLGLVDVETAENLLSEQYDRASSDPFLLQDELVRAIAGVLAPEVLKLERTRAVQRPPSQPGVYDLYERGMWHRYRNTREDLAQAEILFRQVLVIDPGYARATAALSLCRNFAAISLWVPDVAAAHLESLVLARRAVADDPRDPHAHFALGVACMNNARRSEAIDELHEAIRLNPSHSFAQANLGHLYNYLDRPQQALPLIDIALRLNPHDPRRFMWLPYLAASHYLAGRYKECLAACDQALAANPGYPHALRYIVAALGRLGRSAEAGRLLPLMRPQDFARNEELCRSLFVHTAADRLIEGRRLAGFG